MKIKKIEKKEFEKVLRSHILDCSENDLRFTFNAMGFDLKDFVKKDSLVSFEIHHMRTFVVKVDVMPTILIYENIWLHFDNQKDPNRIQLPEPPTLGELIISFVSIFGPSVLDKINYRPCYIDGWSATDTPEEGTEYWDMIHAISVQLHKNTMLGPGAGKN